MKHNRITFEKKNSIHMFTKLSISACSFLVLTFGSPVAFSQTLIVPQVSDRILMEYLGEAVADYKVIRPNAGAAFTTPASLAPLPCEVPRLDLLRMVDAVGLIDEPAEVRRAYLRAMRNLGPEYIKSEYRFEALEVKAIKAQCKNGVLDGNVELWATGARIDDNVKFIGTQKFLRRIDFKVANGKPVGRIRTWTRGGRENTYVDPQMAEIMKKSTGPKVSEAWFLSYKDFGADAPAVTFSFVELTGPASTSEVIAISKPLSNGGYERSQYDQGQLTSTQQFKNGDGHGLLVMYPSRSNMLKEKIVQCLRNGEIYKADPCDVD